MSHFLAFLCLFFMTKLLLYNNWVQHKLSGYIGWSDGHCLSYISPASSSCSLVLPSGSPMAAWAFMWMKSDRTKPCFCGYLSHRLVLASSLWLSAERHLVGMSWKCNRSLSVSHLKYVWVWVWVRVLGGGNSRSSCLNLWSYCCFSWKQSKLTCHVESNLAGDSLNNS